MTEQHPITPPPELVEKWFNDSPLDRGLTLATRAAQWGADQELEECINFVYDNELCEPDFHEDLRATRRPKPPSLKEQALEELAEWENVMDIAPDSPIRRALEALPND
jgi:hypothetical protein